MVVLTADLRQLAVIGLNGVCLNIQWQPTCAYDYFESIDTYFGKLLCLFDRGQSDNEKYSTPSFKQRPTKIKRIVSNYYIEWVYGSITKATIYIEVGTRYNCSVADFLYKLAVSKSLFPLWKMAANLDFEPMLPAKIDMHQNLIDCLRTRGHVVMTDWVWS